MTNTYNTTGGTKASIWDTARFGCLALIAVILNFVFNLLNIPLGGAILSIAALVLAIISIVKKEQPKWPAIIVIVLALIGLVLTVLAFLAVGALIAVAG